MSHALSKGRYPRQPDGSAVLATCREDFRKFKDRNGNIELEHLSTLIKDLEKRGLDPDIYKKQKENLEEVRSLITKGEEIVAFTRFTRTFPYCMPHRSIL
ncbi:MAG: hypothetical protein HWN80_00290 [Candidatus Lokiarchaeota archaeon]|nr:hypothetical protein [Candidatus Lokiarchaeota archaeon]